MAMTFTSRFKQDANRVAASRRRRRNNHARLMVGDKLLVGSDAPPKRFVRNPQPRPTARRSATRGVRV